MFVNAVVVGHNYRAAYQRRRIGTAQAKTRSGKDARSLRLGVFGSHPVVTEGGIDFGELRLVLGDEVDEGVERYAFTWPGKAGPIRRSWASSTATRHTLLRRQRPPFLSCACAIVRVVPP